MDQKRLLIAILASFAILGVFTFIQEKFLPHPPPPAAVAPLATQQAADAGQTAAEGAHAADHHGAFQRTNNPGREWPAHEQGADARNEEERGAEHQAPDATPERAHFAPVLHAVAGIVVADDLLVRVIVASNDGKLLHVKAGGLQLFDRSFGFSVG